jgi:tRNA nucleotidyltransferase (CCA-adding enzyme)
MVRDLILNEENTDVDLVVEGNGINYAKKLAKLLKGLVTIHPKFQTAVIALAGHLKIDVASSRTEYYEHPASLPTIERGMVRQDLYRRDFTINTLAIDLSGAAFGTLVDYFGGRRDIREGKIRALQSLSFIEDPTRVYRAIRFAARFGFEIAKETQHLIGVASKKGIFDRLSGRRIMKELELIFEDEHAVKAIRMMDSFHLLEFFSKEMRLTKSSYSILEQIEEVLAWYRLLYLCEKPKSWNIYLMGLCDAMDEKARTETAERLGLSGREKEKFLRYKFWIHQFVSEIQRKERFRMSDIYFLCSDLPLEIILFLIARTGRLELKKALTKYLLNYRKMKLEIDGEDLKSLGLKPGPAFADLFRLILKAKIEGRVRKKKDEISLALKLIKKRQTT